MSLIVLTTLPDRIAKPSHVPVEGVRTGNSDARTQPEAPRVPWPAGLVTAIVNVCIFVRAGTGGVQLIPPPVATRLNVYVPAFSGVPDSVIAVPSKVSPG